MITIYEQYFKARFDYNEEIKDIAQTRLILKKEDNILIYRVHITFTSNNDNHPFIYEKEIYRGEGERKPAREDAFLNAFIIHANQICDVTESSIYWDHPISEAIYN